MDTSELDGGYQTTDAENQISAFKNTSRRSNDDDDFSFHTGNEVPELL